MTNQQQSSKALNISLWIAQVFVAAIFIWAATSKLFQPIEKIAAMWPWTGEVPSLMVRLLGVVDLLGGLGLILPSLLRIKPRLTAYTAIAIIALMVCASIFHIARGEAAVIGFNIFMAAIAAFIAWGRLKQ
ncbi:DoxX family protein [Chitinophaga ginsengisoli]|uniref:DoxX-like protein n=1 Tax=Chitinophaga ginsengisoli TaxID=363837 RepID=A0A2P8FMT4_9BACT|nr:DoxX family protein [Chitinophaga ginsengisoli]PSL23044.1 DoxX-like protein [Chitinophaga ginsengisoli]